MERRNDIGILKSIGWPNRSVISQILAESCIQSLLGGLIGCILALFLLTLFPVGDLLGVDESVKLSVNLIIVLTGYFLTVLAGTLAGVLAAIPAVRMQPAEILRDL